MLVLIRTRFDAMAEAGMELPEWYRDMEKDLECPVCLNSILDPPVYVCENQHDLCSTCHEKLTNRVSSGNLIITFAAYIYQANSRAAKLNILLNEIKENFGRTQGCLQAQFFRKILVR